MIKELTQIAEKELIRNTYLPVYPKGSPRFLLQEVLECFEHGARIQDNLVYLVGSTVIHGAGNDVDLIIRGEHLSEKEQEAVCFRLYRAFSRYFNIPYNDVTDYLHITFSNEGVYTDFVPLYDLCMYPSDDKHIHVMSKKLKQRQNERIIAGYASVSIVDLEDDLIPLSTLAKMWNKWLETDESYHNLMLEHESIQIGKVLKEYGKLKSGVDDKGLFIIASLRTDIKTADRIWRNILDGELNSFSIRLEVLDQDMKCNDQDNFCWDEIEDANLLEISIVKHPANPEARFYILQY